MKRNRSVLASLLGAACASPAIGATIRGDISESNYQTEGALSQFAAAGYVEINGGQVFGSGTLIAPDWVLTAAHAVTQDTTGFPIYPAADVTFGQGATASYPGANVAAQVLVEPGWNFDLGLGVDLALIKLATPITNVPPAQLYTSSLGTEKGQQATIIGYGQTGTGLTGDVQTFGTRLGITNIVDAFGGDSVLPQDAVDTSPNLMYTDFDEPGVPSASLFGSTSPTALEGASAPGDSGGGLYLTVNGRTYLAGVTDFLSDVPGNPISINPDGYYGDFNGYVRLSVSQSTAFLASALVTNSSWSAAGGGTWDSLSNWTGSNIPEFAGATATFAAAQTSAVPVALDAAWTVGSVTFSAPTNSYTLSPGSGGSLTLDNGGLSATAALTDSAGSHFISAPMALNSNLLVTITRPGDVLTISGNVSGGGSVSFSGGGTLTLAGTNTYAGSTNITSGTVVVSTAASLPEGNALTVGTGTLAARLQLQPGVRTLTLSSLMINSASTVDIGTGALAIDYSGVSPLTAILAALASGYNSGLWTGKGIVSSTAGSSSLKYTVGYADGNKDSNTSAAPNQVLVMYTLAGDATLDGSVGFGDLLAVAQHYGGTGYDWAQGNFNYDPQGSVGFSDLLMLTQNYGGSVSHALPQVLEIISLPEPSGIAVSMVAVMGPLLLRRRRRG